MKSTRHGHYIGRLLAALAGTTPAFTRDYSSEQTGTARRLLAALAGSTAPFCRNPSDQYRAHGISCTATPSELSSSDSPIPLYQVDSTDQPDSYGSKLENKDSAGVLKNDSIDGSVRRIPYSAVISSRHPALLILAIDQSSSMSDPWSATGQSKSEALAAAVNRLLEMAVVLSSRGGGRVVNYFEVGIVGYGGGVSPILAGSDSGHLIVPVEQLAKNPLRVDSATLRAPDGAGGFLLVDMARPVWVEPRAYGAAPMVGAFSALEPVVASWCASHPASFPPIVINVTGGKSADGDPREVGKRIRNLRTEDGHALLFNVHLSGGRNRPLYFPNSSADLLDSEAAILYELSSELPMSMREAAASLGYAVSKGARGLVYNSDELAATDLLEIGTRSVTPNGLHELVSAGRGVRG